VSPSVPDRVHQLAAELELRFAHDAKPARRLEDAHDRLQVKHVATLKLTEGMITAGQHREATVPRPLPCQRRWQWPRLTT
jgi:hypothetical protein